MDKCCKAVAAGILLACSLGAQAGVGAAPAATIRSVSVLGAGSSLEIEVVSSAPITPQAQVISGPDRVVLDFPNAVPGEKLRDLLVNRGELKGVRVGRFSANPPVTRIVLDLKSTQSYQLFPSGKTVILKLASAATTPVTQATQTPAPTPVIAPPPKVEVSFTNGKLKIWANRATLAEVLAEVRKRTGAEVNLPPGTGQEPIVANLGPAPARQVLAALLYGSPFNFVIIGSDRDTTQLRGIFLTPRDGNAGGMAQTYSAVAQGSSMQPAPDMESQPSEPEPPQPQPEEAPQPPPAEDGSPR